VEDYRQKGYLPEALLNFSALLGWHSKGEQEIFTLAELIKIFDFHDMGTSPAVLDSEKLDYLNGYYIRQKPIEELAVLCCPYLEENLKKIADPVRQTPEYIKRVVSLEQERLKKLSDIGEMTEFFFVDDLIYEPELLVWKKCTPAMIQKNLLILKEIIEKIPKENWTNDSIEDAVMSYLQAKSLKIGEYLWPLRSALTGRQASPGPFDVADILGKETSLKRIELAIKILSEILIDN